MNAFRLASGVEIYLHGKWHVVTGVDNHRGCVSLADCDGVLSTLSFDDLVHHPALTRDGDRKAPMDLVSGLADKHRAAALLRIQHINEAMTGFRSGEPNQPLPGEPKPEYDPKHQLQKDRLEAKARELNSEFAQMLGVKMSARTMRRLWPSIKNGSAFQAVAGAHKPRRSRGRRSICREVAEESFRLVEDRRTASNKTVRGLYIELRGRFLANGYSAEWMQENFPQEQSWRRFAGDHWTKSELTGKSRSRASATSAPPGGFRRTNPTRPGQIVFMDTNSLDVVLEGTGIEGAVSGSLIVGLDQYSRSVCSVRVVEQAEKDLDIGFAILDLSKPKQMRADWPDEARWPFVGIPEGVLGISLTGTGTGIAGLPIVNPEALTLDHGGSYKSHKTRDLARRFDIDLLPARTYTGSDKAWLERWFGALRTMLLEHLRGYRGSDVSERGKNVDAEVEWTAQRLEDLIAWWAVRVWQTHIMDDVRPPWCPEGDWSPNSLYQHGLDTSGLWPRLMTSEDYYSVMSTSHVKVHSRGVNIRGLWYDDDPDSGDGVLDTRRYKPAPNGSHKWTVQYDRRDLRHVWFVDETGERHLLRWVGALGDCPAFADRHVNALRNRVDGNLRQYDDDYLAEILLTEILPVRAADGWTAAGRAANRAASSHARDQELAASDAERHGNPTPATAAQNTAPTSTDPNRSGSTVGQARRAKRERATSHAAPQAPGRLTGPPSSMLGTLAALREDEQ